MRLNLLISFIGIKGTLSDSRTDDNDSKRQRNECEINWIKSGNILGSTQPNGCINRAFSEKKTCAIYGFCAILEHFLFSDF